MTENAGASDLAGAASERPTEPPKEPQELRPIIWGNELDEDPYDFRPKPVPSDEPEVDAGDPKDSSAAELVDSSVGATTTTKPSSGQRVKTAAQTAEKGSTQPKG